MAEISTQRDYVAPTTPEEKMLCELAQKILKIEKVSVTDDFLVLGVDSLLSLKLMFQLKSMGLTDDLSKEILSGKTIREIAAQISSSAESVVAPSAENQEKRVKHLSVLKMTEAINAVRGIAILVIIFNHWIGGLLNKLFDPEFAHQLSDILRFPGTPTFALAFGLFLSYLYSDNFQKGNFSNGLRFINSRIFILLLSIFLVSLPSYINMFVIGDFSATAFVKATYSVINYYFLAMLTIPLLLYLLLRTKWSIEITVILAVISMSIAVYLRNFIEWPLWQEGWMLWVKLNTVAYYGYFNLLAFSLLGVAIGLFLKGFKHENRQIYTLLVIALILILIGVLLGGHDHLVQKLRFLFPQLLFHTGVALLVILCMLMISQLKGKTGHFLLTIRSLLATMGIMTLPLYILHGYVIPVKDTFMYFGMAKPIALVIPLILFFFIIGWLAKTIHKTKATF